MRTRTAAQKTALVTRSGRVRGTNKEDEAVSLADQPTMPQKRTRRGAEPKSSQRITKVSETVETAEHILQPASKKQKVAQEPVNVPIEEVRATRTKKRVVEDKQKEEDPPIKAATTRTTRKTVAKKDETPDELAAPVRSSRRDKVKLVPEKTDKKNTATRKRGATVQEDGQKVEEPTPIPQPLKTAIKPTNSAVESPEPPQSPLKQNPVSSTSTISIAIEGTNKTPAMKGNSGTETPQTVPLQRSPVYLQHQQPGKEPTTSPVAPPISVQKKPTPSDDPFQLMPLRKSTAPRPTKITPVTASAAADDIYGFDFNESSEPQQQQKKKPVGAKKRAAKPKQPPKAKKPTEPSGMKLWDDKDFKQRQRQIKVTVINKDFKAQEKPIPPPPIRTVLPKNLQQFPTKPLMNSTAKDHLASPPPPEIHITDVNIEPVERHQQRQPQPDLSKNQSGGDNNSRLIPWRYSTIRNASVANVTMSSLNDSNAENFHPASKGGSRNLTATMSRPLHTLQLQRSPMKELNPNETILVPRPIKSKPVSPTKRVFGVENNFGFDSDNEENDPENLAARRKKMSEKLDSLKKFRHSLNANNSSSPLAGPMRVPARTKVPAAPALPKPGAAIRNIFTSTPQQVKIRDAFKASTPIAGSSKQLQKENLDASTTTTIPDEGHKLFESLTFEAPPKRNYSAMAPRRKKKVDFYGFSDDDHEDDASADEKDDSEASAPRPRATKKAKVQLVQEEKLAKFVDEFNSMCDEVDQYELVIE